MITVKIADVKDLGEIISKIKDDSCRPQAEDILWIMWEKNQILGFGALFLNNGIKPEVRGIYIENDPGDTLSIGMLKTMEDYLRQRNYEALWVRREKDKGLYKRYGFESDGTFLVKKIDPRAKGC